MLKTKKAVNLQSKIISIEKLFKSNKDKKLIRDAFKLAQKAHKGQTRASKEPYITHPVAAALTLAEMNMDATTVAAALLHDVIDDTDITLKELEEKFGKEIAFLVEGVSKLGKLKYRGMERYAENLRKVMVAMAQDVRVILIKFADRLHNVKTLDALEPRKQHRIALETLEIYAPIAMRLGVSELGEQLEDAAFLYTYPDQYKYIKTEADYRLQDAKEYMERLRPVLKQMLEKEGIKAKKIEMRVKHYYSLWKKLEKYNYNWAQVHDLIAVRVIVSTVEDCYRALGTIHKTWRPMLGRIKDFIAIPKPNGYQSLHTTVFCLDGRRIEIQIRTLEMHANAEYGIANHWRYKSKQSTQEIQKAYKWLEQLQEIKQDTLKSEELLGNLKLDVFSDRIFVFTPKGDAVDLPQGATPIDFAYAVHSNIGDKCSGAICNGKMVPLSFELQNGDILEIITSKNKTPSQAWLTFVKTRAAKGHIKRWFKKQDEGKNKEIGLNLLNEELKLLSGTSWSKLDKTLVQKTLEKLSIKNEDELFIAIGQGDISVVRAAQSLTGIKKDEQKKKIKLSVGIKKEAMPIKIAGASGIKARIAQCCNPVKPDSIAAYITIDKGASIHKVDCQNIVRTNSKLDKVLPAYWQEIDSSNSVTLRILSTDRIGIAQDITKIISGSKINILSLSAGKYNNFLKTKSPEIDGDIEIKVEVEISNFNQLRSLVGRLKTVESVLRVERLNN